MPHHLYLHLPYCRRKCPYCDFFKKVPKSGEREDFVNKLVQEIDLAYSLLPDFRQVARTVYFGGGTPSLHSISEIEMLLTRVAERWGIESTAEITLETNPGTVDFNQLSAFRQCGVNRLSIGVQSFSQRKLGLLFRDHTVEEAERCILWSKQAGFENISLDLIFGLPGKILEEWEGDISSALKFEPQHVSLYNLEFHDGTPFDHWRKSGRMQPLDEDLESELYLRTHNLLSAAGFEHYEVSNFALPGFRAVHNSAYWQGYPYLGLGPSAHSFDGNNCRFSNVKNIPEYLAKISAGELPIAERTSNNEREQNEEWISLGLRRSEGIQLEDAMTFLGREMALNLFRRAAELPADLRRLTPEHFSLTPEGWFRENSILLFLFNNLDVSAASPAFPSSFEF